MVEAEQQKERSSEKKLCLDIHQRLTQKGSPATHGRRFGGSLWTVHVLMVILDSALLGNALFLKPF